MINTDSKPLSQWLKTPSAVYGSYVGLLVLWAYSREFLSFAIVGWLEAVFETRLPRLTAMIDGSYLFVFLLFALSIFTTVTNWQWFKRHWHINVILFIISGFLILMILFNGKN